MFLGDLLSFRTPILALRMTHILHFVPIFPLPPSIVTFLKIRYLLNFLRLPQSLSTFNLTTSVMSSSVKTPSQPVADLKFKLGNISDDILSGMELEKMRNLLITARDTIVPISPISSSLVVPSNLLSTSMSLPSVTLSSSTIPKIDRVRSIALSGGIMTFTGPLVFFNSQTSFNANFGVDLTILRFTSRNKCQCATENTEYLASKFLYSEIFVVSIYLVILSN